MQGGAIITWIQNGTIYPTARPEFIHMHVFMYIDQYMHTEFPQNSP